jgi:hypothetical protein
MKASEYEDDFTIETEECEDYDCEEIIENPEEFNYGGSAVMKSNGAEFIEAFPYLLLIVIFCTIVFYFCNSTIKI